MLNALIQYAKINLPDIESGFTRKQVKWAICCDQAGRYTGLLELGDDKGRWFKKSPVTPNMNSGGKSHFLAETLDTVTLFGKELLTEKKDQDNLSAKHQFFRELLCQASKQVPLFNTLTALLSDNEQLAQIHQDIAAKDKIKITDITTFRINETIPLELNIWHDWWRSYYEKATNDGKTSNLTRCLLTGDLINALDSHPKVKGLVPVGGQPSGDVIVGMDKDAFQSYGFKKSKNAAMSDQTASTYVESLNLLIDQNGMRLGNTIVVHWFNKKLDIPEQDDPLAWLQSPPEQEETSALFTSKKMLKAIHSGERPDLENNQYYALMLSGAAGRVMIRDWVEGSFTELVENINQWFDDLAIIARHGESLAPPPKFMWVVDALVREKKGGKKEELPALIIQQLWHAAVINFCIPYHALSKATLRTRIDVIENKQPSHARMGLIKAYHCRKGDIAMRETVNPNHPEAAYHCGRLLAVLARLQHSALGDVGAGVVQRYYTAASQTPALLIGRLIANAKNHLNKLEGGLAFWYEDRIAEVMTAIGDYAPPTLTLEKQSLFALGYYQQLAEMKKKKIPSQNDTQTSIDSL